jgi:nucleoside-diphosphate-sugar epimerase
VVRRLLDSGHRVIGYGRRRESGLPDHPRFEYRRWDIAEGRAQGAPVDGAVHCAGSVTEWGSDAEFEAANVTGTRNVLATFDEAKSFVHMSTGSVYDLRAAKRDIGEDAPLAATYLSGYTRSKIVAEGLVASSRRDSVILRPHIVYGPGEKKILPRLLGMRRLGAVAVAGSGNNRLSLTHVENLADAVVLALQRHHGNEVFNIADSVTGTVDEVLASLQVAFDFVPRTIHLPWRLAWSAAVVAEAAHRSVLRGTSPRVTRFLVAQLANEFTLDCSRAHIKLGYAPRRSYPEAFEELARIMRPHSSAVATL